MSGVTNAKSYVVQQALKDGRTRRVTIGRTNVLTLEQATERGKELLAVFYTGRDPKAGRRGEATLRSALEEYLALRADLKPRSVANYRDLVQRHLAQWLDRPLRSVTRQMVEERLRAIGARTGNASANGTMRALRVLYNFSADRAPPDNPMPPNPVRLKKTWLPVEVRTRSVKADELPRFYAAVRALRNQVARDYILLLLFTGLRRREASALTWSEVDLDARVIRLPAARAKAGRKLDLPMSDLVFDLLSARRALGDARWVFPAPSASGHIEEPKFPFAQVGRATGISVSAHDMRRTFVTVAEGADISPLALKALVNHALGNDVTEGYVQMTAERLRGPAQRVAAELKRLCGYAPA